MSKKRRPKLVARVKTPGEIAVTVPLLLGFHPTESLVVLCGHEPRGRIELSFRVDLPEPHQLDAMVDLVECYVRRDRATRYSLLVFSDEQRARPHEVFVEELRERLADLREMEVLLVRDGRWWSYTCEGSCCPAEGTLLSEDAASEPVTLIASERVLRGEVVAGSREELAARLAGPTFLAAEVAFQRCLEAADRFEALERELGPVGMARMLAGRWDAAVAGFGSPPGELADDEAALLVMSLENPDVRDHVTSTPADDRPVVLALLAELLRRTPAPVDGIVAAAFGWLTYLEGGGAMASIAAERALASDPTQSLVRLLDQVLVNAVPPQQLRDIWEKGARRLTA